MINLNISNYNAPFSHLNGQTTQKVTPMDLARGMVTVGRGSWSDVSNLGIFRIGELICKALAFSKLEHGNLVLQSRFRYLDQSEKATVSYYFGQALTKLYAEEFLKLKWLLNVNQINGINYHIRGQANPKVNVGVTFKNAARPDLVGIEGFNKTHIFEAKGRSTGYNVNEMQHAIDQVSQIKNVNGAPPLTRSACYFDLSTTPINGIIIDPESDTNGIDFLFDEVSAISQYYLFFKENVDLFYTQANIFGYDFQLIPVGVPNIYFGFDKRILEISSKEFISYNFYDWAVDYEKHDNISLGLDGIILIDNRNNGKRNLHYVQITT